jgi:hypothetical protein
MIEMMFAESGCSAGNFAALLLSEDSSPAELVKNSAGLDVLLR